jgi:hypothetical protein
MIGTGAFAKSRRPVNELKSDVFGLTGKAVPTPETQKQPFVDPQEHTFQTIAALPSIGPSTVKVCKHKILPNVLGKAVSDSAGVWVFLYLENGSHVRQR